MALAFGSVCSGIEAASVAWNPLGWRAAFASEIDPFPRAVLKHRHPDVPLHGDFTTIGSDDYAAIDVLVGGTPCQSFSIAGLRKGLADERGNLALEFCLLARRLGPRWVVWENVPGVLSMDGGRAFASILGGLAECGYGLAYRVLDAQFVRVDGFGRAVPQRRRRVFVVGYLGDWRRAAAVLFERQSLSWDSPPRRQAGQRPAPTLSARTKGGGGLGTDFDCDGGLIHFQGRGTNLEFGGDVAGTLGTTIDRASGAAPCIAHTLNAKGGLSRIDSESETFIPVAHALRADGFDASEDGTGRGTPIIPIDMRQASRGETITNNRASGSGGAPGHGIGNVGDPAFTVSERGQAIAFSCKDHGADAANGVSPTLRAMNHGASHANAGGQCAVAYRTTGNDGVYETGDITAALQTATDPNQITLLQSWRVRRLTPLECERLQGFPDGYTDVPYRRRNYTPDGPRYKALGNSFAVNVVRWIGQRIDAVDKIQAEGLTP